MNFNDPKQMISESNFFHFTSSSIYNLNPLAPRELLKRDFIVFNLCIAHVFQRMIYKFNVKLHKMNAYREVICVLLLFTCYISKTTTHDDEIRPGHSVLEGIKQIQFLSILVKHNPCFTWSSNWTLNVFSKAAHCAKNLYII